LKALETEDSFPAFASTNASQGAVLSPAVMPRNFLAAAGLKTNQDDPDYSGLFKLLDVLNNEPEATFPQEIEKVLNVDEALRFLAVSASHRTTTSASLSCLYEVDGKFPSSVDLNMTFGTFNGGIRRTASSTTHRQPTAARWTGSPRRPPAVLPAVPEIYHGYLRSSWTVHSPDAVLPSDSWRR
jgi:hypothetical protein